MIVYKKYF